MGQGEEMSNELMVYQEVQDFAKAMVASGYFMDVKQVSQAIVKIQAGAELGLPPFASMSGIHIIKGKPQLGANLIASLIKNDSRYDFKVKEISDEVCTIAFFEAGQHLGDSTFTVEDAKRAGTQNMGKFPRNMLYARAMSNGAKWYVPGIFGGAPVYVPGELSPVNEDVDVVTGEIVEVTDGKMNSEIDDIEADEAEDEAAADADAEFDAIPSASDSRAQKPPVKPQQPKSKEAVVDTPAYTIEEIRAMVAESDPIKAGLVADRLAMTGLYNERQHALNAMRMWPGLNGNKLLMKTPLKAETAVALFDWCVERKQTKTLVFGGKVAK